MISKNILQWDEVYPQKNHLYEDILKKELYIGMLDAFSKNPFSLRMYEKAEYKIVGHADWRKGRFYLMEKKLIF